MKSIFAATVLAASALTISPSVAKIPAAIYTDPVDKVNPAKMEVIHIPSGGVEINGLVYMAAGAGPHTTVVLCHGLPGNEKNLDLAQAMRRAGYNVITFNYRGSWGSPGNYRFAQDLEDADAVLSYARDPANAAKLRIDPKRLVIMGHSLGGWVTALTAAHDKGLLGAALISAANLGARGAMPRDVLAKAMLDNGMETLAGTSAEIMADELIANKERFNFLQAAPQLAGTRLLVLSSDDGLAPGTDALMAGISASGGNKVKAVHVATDHSWSDKRIRLQTEIINWLATLK